MVWRPTHETVANMTSEAPPRTGGGIVATTAPAFGSVPSATMTAPAPVATQRDLTRVIPTSPTFWAKHVYGKEFMTPPRRVEAPSALMAAATSRPSMRLPTISPVAKTSPVVSTIVMSMTTIIDAQPRSVNRGAPKCRGVVTSKAAAPWKASTFSAERPPAARAASVPPTRPTSTAIVARNPVKSRWMSTMAASVPNARPRSAAAGRPAAWPTKSSAEIARRLVPMTSRTVPVTTGGKKRRSRAK